MVELTIITAVRNAVKSGNADALRRCVESVAVLPFEHEHLIYDACSEDGSVAILEELSADFPNMKYVSEPDNGIYDAYNKGVRDAVAEWVYFLGCDDYICDGGAMEEALTLAESKKIDFVISPVNEGNTHLFYPRMKARLQCMPYSHQGVIMRKDIILRFGGFDTRYRISADADLTFKLHLANVPYLVLNKVYAYFGLGGASTTSYERTRDDTTRSIACGLSLNERQRMLLFHKRVLPIYKVFRFLFHKDLALRASARCQIGRRVCDLLGLIRKDGVFRLSF